MADTVFERALGKARDKGWNQSDLAVRLGLSPQNVTNWKSRGVPPEKYVALADVLDCSLDELLGRLKYVTGHKPATALWPFESLDESKLRNLELSDASKLEGAIIYAAAQLGLDVKK